MNHIQGVCGLFPTKLVWAIFDAFLAGHLVQTNQLRVTGCQYIEQPIQWGVSQKGWREC